MKSTATRLALIFIFLIHSNNSFSQIQSYLDSITVSKYKEVAGKFVSTALRDRMGYEALRNLCHIGPRLSGSRNSLIAINWAKHKMEELNFDSVWLQPVKVPHWERGSIEEVVILNHETLNEINLNALALGGSIGTTENGITASVIEITSFEELKQRKQEVDGKIVFFSTGIDQSTKNTFSAYSNTAHFRVHGATEAAYFGAVAVIVRSLTTKYDNVPHTGITIYQDSVKKIPAVSIGYLDADYLSQKIKEDSQTEIRIKLDCRNLPEADSYNVIGEIRGSDYPDEVIVVGGHFDSWDVGNGAHDDGVGCIQAIEVLDLFNRLNIKPKRTIRVVLFINEENGTRGGKEYGKYADTSKQIHYAAIESDRGAFTPVGFYVDTDSLELIQRIESWLPFLEYAGIHWVRKGGSGVDISKIKNANVLIGYYPDEQRYFDFHHSPSDVFEAVHPREFELGSAAMVILTFLLSEEGL